jgi:26S proteasome regulatory subunit T2
LDRIKDFLLIEEEFIQNQERLKPTEQKSQEERSKVDDLRGSPMNVGSLEEIIDDNHGKEIFFEEHAKNKHEIDILFILFSLLAIVSSSVGSEYYVSMLSIVDKDQLEPGSSVLLHNKTMAVVGLLQDEVDPMVSVMKVEKAPL